LTAAKRDRDEHLGHDEKHCSDAMIVAVAVKHGAREIMTGDPEDIAALSSRDLSIISL
jgi:predicted nucleic acid-binding protein